MDSGAEKPSVMISISPRLPPSRCTIANIPPELLSEVFSLIRAETVWNEFSTATSMFYTGSHSPAELITLTSTCRIWRYVALDSQSIWTTISSTYSPEIATWMVRNSGQLPITSIECDRERTPNPTSAVVWAELSRVHNLCVSVAIDGREANREANGLLVKRLAQAGSLKRLCLLSNARLVDTVVLPSLRHLSISHYSYPSNEMFPSAPNLRSIAFKTWDGTAGTRTLGTLAHFSLQYPSLGYLTLNFSDGVNLPLESPSCVSFPNLEQLQIECGSFHEVSYLVGNIRVPSSCRIGLTACLGGLDSGYESHKTEVDLIVSLILQRTDVHFSGGLPRELFRVAYVQVVGNVLSVGMDCVDHGIATWPWNELWTFVTPQLPTAIFLQFQLYSNGFEYLLCILLQLSLVEIAVFRLDRHTYDETSETWPLVFEQLSAVTTLRVNNDLGRWRSFEHVMSGPTRVCLPSLRHLVLDVSSFADDFCERLMLWMKEQNRYGGGVIETLVLNAGGQLDRDNFDATLQKCQAIEGLTVTASQLSEIYEETLEVRYVRFD